MEMINVEMPAYLAQAFLTFATDVVDRLGDNGCNDCPVPNHAHNRELANWMEARNQHMDLDTFLASGLPEIERPQAGTKRYLLDYVVASNVVDMVQQAVDARFGTQIKPPTCGTQCGVDHG